MAVTVAEHAGTKVALSFIEFNSSWSRFSKRTSPRLVYADLLSDTQGTTQNVLEQAARKTSIGSSVLLFLAEFALILYRTYGSPNGKATCTLSRRMMFLNPLT